MSATVRLDDGETSVDIAPLGAELKSWSVRGTPLIWEPDAAIWPDTAPLLFPVVGWTRGGEVLIDGKRYPLSLHGFARTMPFVITDQSAHHVRLELRTSAQSLALYPFSFLLAATYRLLDGALRIELAIHNEGQGPMPYACGVHPGFRWPFAGGNQSDYTITFAEAEEPNIPVISVGGLFTRQVRPIPLRDKLLPLSAELFAREALCFLNVRSQAVRFACKTGQALELRLENFPHLALWSRPAGRFLSIEAWTGHGDEVDSNNDLMTKPSMIHLAPGASGRHAAMLRFEG